ncbi:GntR family transcriptional regulator [Falsihalocynthiibacter arcticus]|uniref:GntR family transcriptional regulator n=1 Tax=Falsihalocynthiibacter arcticus TaxID=1579316 RepID=A0A126V246_9RHOB|nr:GntR family transcriptional regulator [Falsihalocynthiibacter arcticus]AML52025.1 GntR family transcriptional regulator [Falsihalocynthiibacter arcticus]
MEKLDLSPAVETTSSEPSATHSAYLALRKMILAGELEPGTKLKIETLRKKLDTGASPIREALSLLTSDQLVERIDQRGFKTAAASKANFEEILHLRCALESMALRMSIERVNDAWEENIVLAHHRMVRAQGETTEVFEAHHRAFHMALLENCGSPILLRMCGQLYDLNIRYRFLANRSQNYTKRDVSGEHEKLLEACVDQNADLVTERLCDHYTKTGAFLTGLFTNG